MGTNYCIPFPDPFGDQHCGAIAFAMMHKGPDACLAASIADVMRQTKRVTTSNKLPSRLMMWGEGRSSGLAPDLRAMAQKLGLRILAELRFPGATPFGTLHDYRQDRPVMTVRRFAERYNRGRWYVIVAGHALAVVNGKIYNAQTTRDWPVLLAIRMAHKEEIGTWQATKRRCKRVTP